MANEAIFGAGCFWSVERAFGRLPGVLETEVGYCGGRTENPTYEDVCRGDTGHAEVVRVRFHPEETSYRKLVKFFFETHDPTTPNRQGPDVGSQYRSVIFFQDEEQKKVAESVVQQLTDSGRFASPIVTHIEGAPSFYLAEEYHQKYLEKKSKKVW